MTPPDQALSLTESRPPITRRRRRRGWRPARLLVPFLLLLLLLAGKLAQPPVVLQVQRAAADLLQHLHPRPYVDLPLRVLEIDDESLTRYGQWPWPRTVLADLLQRLHANGAALVAFDIMFSEPDRVSPQRLLGALGLTERLRAAGIDPATLPDGDAVLAEAMRQMPTVLGFGLSDAPSDGPPPPHPSFGWSGADPKAYLRSYRGVIRSLTPLEQAAVGHGSLNAATDSDGVDRRMPLVATAMGEIYPSLVAETVRVLAGARVFLLKSAGASGERSFGAETGLVAVRAGGGAEGVTVPTDADGNLVLHLTRPAAPRRLPAWRLLDGSLPADAVADRVVLVALTAKGYGDLRPTPAGPRSSAELHAQALEQIMAEDFLERPDWAEGAELLGTLLLGVTLILLVPLMRPVWSAAFAATLILALLGASWLAFLKFNLQLDAIYPSLALSVLFVASTVASFFYTDRDRAFIRGAFARYLSTELVNELANNPDQLRLGGERRELTIIFTDIANFTTLSEQLGPVALARLMNQYFDGACPIILRHGGMVNEFIGDAILAFFGAPIAQPDHAARAVACVRELDAFANAFKDERQAEGIPFGKTRIGLHTGTALVGNFGSTERFKYSALGDVVNTASRIEGLNKYFGTSACASGATVAAAGTVGLRLVGRVVVKGKTEALAIYEIPPAAGSAADFLERYREAYAAMERGAGERALSLFAALHRDAPEDGPTGFHLKRLEQGEVGDLIVMADK